MAINPPFIFHLFAKLVHKGTISLCIGSFDERMAWVAHGSQEGKTVKITLSSKRDLWKMTFRPELAIPEAYMEGRLRLVDTSIDDFVVFLFANKQAFLTTNFGRFCHHVIQIKATLEDDITTHGITLSENQWHYASQQVAARAPSHVKFRLQDYRDENLHYDHIVSVGMIEHVGLKALSGYVKVISRCLNDNGTALLHFIGKRRANKDLSPFINKYIFPGGYIPTLADISSAIAKTDLHITDVECWHTHYAQTLRAWRTRCEQHKQAIITDFDERFWRMWLFYLV